jgi:parallel beta-helix repeat protein
MRIETFLLALALSALPAALLASLIGGCGGGPGLAAGCDRGVSPGADDRTAVQEMFEAAEDGDTLCFAPGVYRFDDGIAIRDKDAITIRGSGATRDDVTLDFSGMGVGNSGLSATAMTHLRIENMTVLDAAANNVFVTDSTDVVFDEIESGWVTRPIESRGRYAIYPVQSTNVVIEDSEAFGSADAGIYVGQTTNCIVRRNVAHDNVAGIEIENSIGCEVHDNEAYDNTGGLLVFELPGLATRGHGTLVHHNAIYDNDLPNFAPTEGAGIVGALPCGIGIVLLAANEVEIRANEIRGNDSTGIAIVSYETAIALGLPAPTDTGYDMYPEDISIHDNTFDMNGTAPCPPLNLIPGMQTPPGTTIEDILSDGRFLSDGDPDNVCIDELGTYRLADINTNFAVQSTDRAFLTCPEGSAITLDPIVVPTF